jgi:hypothetical protein
MNPKLKARLFVVLIFIICAAPIALSFLTYYVWKPQNRMNYGELLQPAPASPTASATSNPYQGKWVLLLVDGPDCAAACEKHLYAMRQTAIAMVMKKEKLAQVWVITPPGAPSPELLTRYPDTNLLVHDLAWLPQLPQPVMGRIFLLDPNGVPVLRYPEDPDVKRMMKDLGRLLDIKRM